MPDDSTNEAPPDPSRLAWNTATALRSGSLLDALAACDEALDVEQRAGRLPGVASVLTIRARVLRLLGRLPQALEAIERAHQLQENRDDGVLSAHVVLERGRCALEAGDASGALERFVEATTGFARQGHPKGDIQAQIAIAAAYHALGDLPGALRHAEVAATAARIQADDSLVAPALERQAELYHELGRRIPARRALREAAEAWHRVSDVPGEQRVAIAAARVSLDLGADVREELAALVQRIDPLGDPWTLGTALSAQGAALGAHGDRLAYTVLAQAEASLRSHPMLRHLPSVDMGFLDLSRSDRGPALRRLGDVPDHALRSVPVRIAMSTLRRRLQSAA